MAHLLQRDVAVGLGDVLLLVLASAQDAHQRRKEYVVFVQGVCVGLHLLDEEVNERLIRVGVPHECHGVDVCSSSCAALGNMHKSDHMGNMVNNRSSLSVLSSLRGEAAFVVCMKRIPMWLFI